MMSETTETKSIAEHFAEHVASQPDAPALIWDGEAITYRELADLAESSYGDLEASNLAEDRPIGIRAKKSPEAIGLILACLRFGRPFLLPSIELASDTLAKLFAAGGCSQVISPHGPRSDSAASLRALVDETRAEDDSASEWPPAEGADGVTFMLTTSGSTGLPKVVPLLASGVDAFTDWAAEQFEIRPGTVVANYAPLNFDLCLLDIWATLKNGGCVAMVDQDRATQGAYLADLVTDNQVNVLQAVPMLYRLLIDVHREDGRTFPSVRHVITTGDKIPTTSLAELPNLFPNARFYNIYGCTETNDSLMHEFLGLSDGNVPSNVPVGQPLPGVTARVQNEAGQPLEGTGTGELLVWTPFQTRGYLKTGPQRRKVCVGRRRRRAHLLPHRRHRSPARRWDPHARGSRRLLRQGPRRARQHAGRRAGHPGAPRGRRGGGRRRHRRARRRPSARGRAPRGRLEAQQPQAPSALREQAGEDRDAFDD